jgi:hypothetical protein
MEQGQNNFLELLLKLGGQPQKAQAALRILDQSSSGLNKSALALRAHTEEITRSTRAQQEAMEVFGRMRTQT